MGARPLGTPAPIPEPKVAVWLVALFLTARATLIALPVAAAFVIVTALASGAIEDERVRLLLGVGVALVLPVLLHWRLGAFLRTRKRRRAPPSFGWFAAAFDGLLALSLALGCADDVGRALRRHGDWFVGERHGALARGYRTAIAWAGDRLERFDPPVELAPVVIPPEPEKIPYGPWRPDEKPPEAEPTVLAWFHPLAGPRRALPLSEGRRFGAARPQPRPSECELGHCGVDLGTTTGEPVFSIFDGVVERIERDEGKGGRAGRYVRIGHKDGTVVSRYIHLDTIRSDLREGMHIAGGELIGRLGHTGIELSGPHLHFGLSKRPAGRGGDEIYIDPEPYLRVWKLPDASALKLAAYTPR